MTFRVVAPAAGLAVLLAACGTGGAAPAPSSTPAHTVTTPAPQTSSPARGTALPGPLTGHAAPLITGSWR